MESSEQTLQRAISTIAQSDPLIKLLREVKLGKMEPTDAGLRAVTVLWLGTYQKVIEAGGLSRQDLRRLDPMPRLAVLIEHGLLSGELQAVASLRACFEVALQRAAE